MYNSGTSPTTGKKILRYMDNLPLGHPGQPRVIRPKDKEIVQAVMYHYKHYHKGHAKWAVVTVEGVVYCIDLTISVTQEIPQREVMR